MTDPKTTFKVPPPPMPRGQAGVSMGASGAPKPVAESLKPKLASANGTSRSPYEGTILEKWGLSPSLLEPKKALLTLCGILFIGIVMGAILFGGKKQQVVQGLMGVISNPEIRGRQVGRCGAVDRTLGCILYLMNASRGDKQARDFYQQASDITGLPQYTIELGNVEYASYRIRPGYIAQIYIPPITHR